MRRHSRERISQLSKCCQESWKSHFETDVRCHSAVSQQSGRKKLPGQNSVWEELHGSRPRKATEIMMLSTESRLNSSGTFSQDSQRCSSVIKSMIFCAIWDKHQKLSQKNILLMSMFNDISCDRNDNKDECLENANIVKTFAGRFGIGQWSFRTIHKELGTTLRNRCCEFAESGHPIFRATTPLSRGSLKSKGRGKLSIHFTADQDTVDTIYRIILSVN